MWPQTPSAVIKALVGLVNAWCTLNGAGPGHARLVEVIDASGPDMSGEKGGLEHIIA